MSRIGNKPVSIPSGVSIEMSDQNVLTVKGPKGTLSQALDPAISVDIEEGELTVKRANDQKKNKALHGLYRSLSNNMVEGVSKGFKKELEIVGVGFKATATNNVLELSLGYSHGIFISLPKEITVTAVTEKGKSPIVTIEGIDKQLVGQVVAKIKSLRKVEPYKGKGIREVGAQIRRKQGKTAAKK